MEVLCAPEIIDKSLKDRIEYNNRKKGEPVHNFSSFVGLS